MSWLAEYLPLVFSTLFFASIGASIGSLINVLVYRIPRGEGVVTPPSKCPHCGTRLTWRENIPVFGWLLLRGKCRFCKSPISPRYPLVEAFVGLLFGAVYFVWFGLDASGALGGSGAWSPEWAENGLFTAWPIFVVFLLLLASLVAMTLIDAETFTIPLILAWIPAVAAVVILPGHALIWTLQHGALSELAPGLWLGENDGWRWRSASGWIWSLPTPALRDWGWIGASCGGVVGLGVSAVLVRAGVLRQSFADYAQWEAEALQAKGDTKSDGVTPDASGAELWVQYPYARREMVKEMAFLAAPSALAWLGWWAFEAWAMGAADPIVDPRTGFVFAGVAAPAWLVVLSGVLWGYLIGGVVVWAVRIFGSLLFGKEAMGIGDVHLMAAVGACVGWIDATIAFFLSPFFALSWVLAGIVLKGKLKRAMPLGPALAAGTFVVILGKPVLEAGLTLLFGSTTGVDLP
ncbi:MAG: prepilin peptidase [Planctomycetota bacterium]